MAAEQSPEVTRLLQLWSNGSEEALQELMEQVYRDLHRIARNHFRRERAGHTLQPTAVVNELFTKLVAQRKVEWESRSQFFAIASRMMRRLLVNHARDRRAAKRRGIHVELEEYHAVSDDPRVDLLAIDAALEKLAVDHPREAQVVELRYFAGMTLEEVAEHLGLGLATIKRDWKFARSFLLACLQEGRDPDA